jgi:aspartate carbamoyltransferase catalytic subunit
MVRNELAAEAVMNHPADADPLMPMIDGDPAGKNLLSTRQLTEDDLYTYIEEARVAESYVADPATRGINVLPFAVSIALMRQPSTRTGGSMATAMDKLGGRGRVYSGMESSSEAKGESLADSYVAVATQTDILGVRTKEENGPRDAAAAIADSFDKGKLSRRVPVINLGNGTDEHVTQAIGDVYTIAGWQNYNRLDGLTVAFVGDHERYRATHSEMLAAKLLGMDMIAVESAAAPVPESLALELGSSLSRTSDLDEAMRAADVLIVGRNPDEYDGDDPAEHQRSLELASAYASWIITNERLQIMHPDSIVLHARPRRNELHISVDGDPRMRDVQQMEKQIATRMAITALHLGVSIVDHARMLERTVPAGARAL